MKLSSIKTPTGKYIAQLFIPWVAYIYASPNKEIGDAISVSAYENIFIKGKSTFQTNVGTPDEKAVKSIGDTPNNKVKGIRVVKTVTPDDTVYSPLEVIAESLGCSLSQLKVGVKAIIKAASSGDFYPIGTIPGYNEIDSEYPKVGFLKGEKNTFPVAKIATGVIKYARFYVGWYNYDDAGSFRDTIDAVEEMAIQILDNLDNLEGHSSSIKSEISALKQLCRLASPNYSFQEETVQIVSKDYPDEPYEFSDGILNALSKYQQLEKEILGSAYATLLKGSITSVADLREANKRTNDNLEFLVKDITKRVNASGLYTITPRSPFAFYAKDLEVIQTTAQALKDPILADNIVSYINETNLALHSYQATLKAMILSKGKGEPLAYPQIAMGFKGLKVAMFFPEGITDSPNDATTIYTDGAKDYVKGSKGFVELSRRSTYKHRITQFNEGYSEKPNEFICKQSAIINAHNETKPQYVYANKLMKARQARRLKQADNIATDFNRLVRKLVGLTDNVEAFKDLKGVDLVKNEKLYNQYCLGSMVTLGLFLGLRSGSSTTTTNKLDDSALGPLTWRKENVKVRGKNITITYYGKGMKETIIKLSPTTLKDLADDLYVGSNSSGNESLAYKALIQAYNVIYHLAKDSRPQSSLLFQKAKGIYEWERELATGSSLYYHTKTEYRFDNMTMKTFLVQFDVVTGGFHSFRKVLGKIILNPIMDIVNEDYKRNKPNNTFKTEKDLTGTLRIRLAKVSKTLQHTVPKNNNVTKVTLFYYIDGSDILDMYNKCNFPVPEVLLNSIDLETAEIKKSMRRA